MLVEVTRSSVSECLPPSVVLPHVAETLSSYYVPNTPSPPLCEPQALLW